MKKKVYVYNLSDQNIFPRVFKVYVGRSGKRIEKQVKKDIRNSFLWNLCKETDGLTSPKDITETILEYYLDPPDIYEVEEVP